MSNINGEGKRTQTERYWKARSSGWGSRKEIVKSAKFSQEVCDEVGRSDRRGSLKLGEAIFYPKEGAWGLDTGRGMLWTEALLY